MTDQELRDAFSDRLARAEQLRIELLVLAGEIDERALWAIDGHVRFAHWTAANSTMTRSEASAFARQAQALRRDMPIVAEALESGRITTQQAKILGEALTSETKVAFVEQEQFLVECAEKVPVDQLPKIVARWKQTVDDDGPIGAYERARRRRSLRLRQMRDGNWELIAVLDAEAGAVLQHRLAEVADELWRAENPDADDPAHEPRTSEQRRADALGEIVRRSTTPQPDVPRHEVPLVIVRTTLDVLLGGDGDSTMGEDRNPIPAETARRLACDSYLARLTVNAKGELLDLGVQVRTATRAQRQFVIERDGPTCVIPGCALPVRFCQAHHLQHFKHGGGTDRDNLVMLCHRHHHLVHEGGWNLARRRDGTIRLIRPEHPTARVPEAACRR